MSLNWKCLLHLPADLYRQGRSTAAQQLLFPSEEDVLSCLGLNVSPDRPKWMSDVKFCLAQMRLDLAEFAGMPPDPHRWLTHVTLSAAVCLPESCSAADITDIFDYVCAVPDCALLPQQNLSFLCFRFQATVCGPTHPHRFEHELMLQCLDVRDITHPITPLLGLSPTTPLLGLGGENVYRADLKHAVRNAKEVSELLGVANLTTTHPDSNPRKPLKELPFKRLISKEAASEKEAASKGAALKGPSLKRASQDSSLADNASSDLTTLLIDRRLGELDVSDILVSDSPKTAPSSSTDTVMSDAELGVLMRCGFRAVESLQLWQLSGSLGTLGDWDACPGTDIPVTAMSPSGLQAPGHYCTLRYLGIMTAGRCVPHGCAEDDLVGLLQLICAYTAGGAATRRRNCLDFVNVIPLDLCLTTQMFGCGDFGAIRNASSVAMDIVMTSLARADLPSTHRSLPADIGRAVDTIDATLHDFFGSALASQLGPVLKGYGVGQLAHLQTVIDRILVQSAAELGFVEQPQAYGLQSEGFNDKISPRSLNTQADGLSVRTFCDFCQRLDTRNSLMLTGAVALVVLAFVLLPLGGWIAGKGNRSANSHRNHTEAAARLLSPGGDAGPAAAAGPAGPAAAANPADPARNVLGVRVWPLQRRVLQCFYVHENVKAYVRTAKKVEAGAFPHLSGIRVLSMLWICLGHTMCFAIMNGPVGNLPFTFDLLRRLDFQLIVSGPFSVDTFFFISGFLLAAYAFPQLEKAMTLPEEESGGQRRMRPLSHQLLGVGLMVFKRYLRLSGVYFFVLALYFWGLRFVRTGPMWPALVEYIDHGDMGGCSEYWWTNVLYINNLYPKSGATCFSWAWFLANDFQFFIISSFLFLLKLRNTKIYKWTNIAMFIGSICIGIYVIRHYNLKIPLMSFSADIPSDAKEWMTPFLGFTQFYMKPWTRIPSHLIGIAFGFLYNADSFKQYFLTLKPENPETLQRSPQPPDLELPSGAASPIQPLLEDTAALTPPPPIASGTIGSLGDVVSAPLSSLTVTADAVESAELETKSSSTILLSHVAALIIMALLIFCVYGPNRAGTMVWPHWLDTMYLALSRSLWCVAIGWLTVSLAHVWQSDKAGQKYRVLRDFLSRQMYWILTWPVFVYTSSLVFTVYLIHPVIQSGFWAAQTKTLRFDRLLLYSHALGFVSLSFLLAYPLAVCIEIPLSRIFRMCKL